MAKIIRLTEQQLKEVEDEATRFSMENPIPQNFNSQITSDGIKSEEEPGKPKDTDDLMNQMTVNYPWNMKISGY